MKRALEISELVAGKMINDITNPGASSIATQVFTYLKINFKNMMAAYDSNNFFQ